MMKINNVHAIYLLLLTSLLLTGCSYSGDSANGGNSGPAGKGCNKIGVLLPDSANSARWDSEDRPYLINDIKKYLPGAKIDYVNAEGNASQQEKQTYNAISRGDCILIITTEDSVLFAKVAKYAYAHKVPIIAYDRLIQDKSISFYVSFDNVKVGELQGQYIADHYKEYTKKPIANLVLLNGSQTDNNSFQFRQGTLDRLQPFLKDGRLKKIYEDFTLYWDNNLAKMKMDEVLRQNHNDVQIAYGANDGIANAIISALKPWGLNGKVLVTGQDATVAGIRNIIIGDQAMTIYKKIPLEADAAAHGAALISKGDSVTSLSGITTTKTTDGGAVPSLLETPITVDKTNISTTVLADGYVTKSSICQNLPANVYTNGICA